MKSISTFVLASAIFGATTVIAGDMTAEGCFSSTTSMTLNGTYDFNSRGKCGGACLALNMAVFATQHFQCFCGQTLPPSTDVLDDGTCNIACPGYPSDVCGSTSAYSVYLTGLTTSASNSDHPPSSGSPKATGTGTAKPSVVTTAGQTVVVTASSQSSKGSSGSSGPNKAAIAAGVVVGIVVMAAVGGGLFLFMRNRKRRAIEEEHRRQAAVSSFIGGGKHPGSSSAGSFTDMRLDPAVMAQRRMSDGSIADNQDYSRRILKVTNA